MKNEHATCRANDIKQKCLLGGNPAQKEKKNQICFLFSLSFIFRILLYFYHYLIFLFFYFNIEDNVVFKVWGIKRILVFFVIFQKQNLCLIFLNSYWFMKIWVLCMRINWDGWRYKLNEWVCMQVLMFNWFRDWLYSVIYQCKLLSFQHYILWLCILSVIYISRTCFISYWDYIHITYIHEDDKGIRNFNHLSQKANLKHIILSEPLLSLFIFSLFYPCVNLNFLYVFLFPGQGLVEHIRVISHKIIVGSYVKRKKKWCLMKRWAKLLKVKNQKEKRKKKCSFMFLRFYVERAWNQKKLSIGD